MEPLPSVLNFLCSVARFRNFPGIFFQQQKGEGSFFHKLRGEGVSSLVTSGPGVMCSAIACVGACVRACYLRDVVRIEYVCVTHGALCVYAMCGACV